MSVFIFGTLLAIDLLTKRKTKSFYARTASLQGILGRLDDQKLNRSGSGSRNHQIFPSN
jgi:hypothetical protein